jgi:hypothetical protein
VWDVRAASRDIEPELLARPHLQKRPPDEAVPIVGNHVIPTAPTLLHLQRHAGNAAVAALLVQRCGSTPCDCPPEKKEKHKNDEPVVEREVVVQRRPAPYIKKITVHLTPPQKAELEWKGTPPSSATGADSFTVSTGKGYGDPGDPPGTCKRQCCSDAEKQCAPPFNQPGKVGSCCTHFGSAFYTGTPQKEHGGWLWWTPIQPYYSQRGIALHQHDEVTGQPIGHGCVRMDEPNAKRIFDFSNRSKTNVTIDGRASPVDCKSDRQCATTGSKPVDAGAPRPAED